jgi:hypothetical protein
MADYRELDVSRGAFEPTPREPIMDREKNPRGTRHILKTAQDNMPVAQRPRVKEWNRQLELRRQGK